MNTIRSQSCQDPDAAGQPQPAGACQASTNSARTISSTSVVRPAARLKLQAAVNLHFVVDRTESSLTFAIGIPATAQIIMDGVAARAQALQCTVWSCGDEETGQQPILHTDRGSKDQAKVDIASITYAGGGDAPETHLSSIEHVLDCTAWSGDRRTHNAVVAMLTADTKPAKSGHTAAQIGDEFRRRGVLLYLVCEPYPRLKELVDSAGGLLFEISNNPDAAQLQKISSQVSASILATVASGGTVPMSTTR